MFWDRWDIALLIIAGYVAVISLVRLMLARRNHLMKKFRQDLAAEQRRQQLAKRQRRKAQQDEHAA